MGSGLSKKEADGAVARARRHPPAPHDPLDAHRLEDDGWEVERVRDDSWDPALPGLGSAAFESPSGGAGVGSLGDRRHPGDGNAGDVARSQLPPTALSLEVLEVGGLSDAAIITPGKADGSPAAELYCVTVLGTVTRVLDSELPVGRDRVRFCGQSVSFPLHGRGELELTGLAMHVSVFLSAISPTDSDRELGECVLPLETQWLYHPAGHTTWLQLRN